MNSTLDLLEGAVERITYVSPEDGYTVLRLAPTTRLGSWSGRDEAGLVTVVGNLPDLQPGESVRLEGQWQTHARHGRQFRAVNVHRVSPATAEGIRRYLGSGMIRGVGPGIAGRIVDLFGLATLDVLEGDPQRLYEVDGVGPKRVRLITAAWEEQRQIKEVMLFLQSHGVTTTLAVKIYKQYGDDSIAQVQQDPYRLARDIRGVGFKTADKIARDLGLALNHPTRIEAGIVYALNEASDEGHVFLPQPELVDLASALLEVTPPEVEAAIGRALQSGLVKLERIPSPDAPPIVAVYLPPYYYAEIGIVRRLRAIASHPTSPLDPPPPQDVPALVSRLAASSGIQLSPLQQKAVQMALCSKVSILTGGPGTGKTTALRTLIRALIEAKKSFALTSPTGRAAKRLSEATGQPARTIHRLLSYSPAQGFAFDEKNPLQFDIIIVDEASMLDEVLAYALFRAIDPRSHLLLVGDVDQLPSVSPGDVLRDLIACGEFPTIRLDVIFRQVQDSHIIANAHRVNRGEMPVFSKSATDFFLFKVSDDDVERAADLVVEIVKERIPRRFGANPLSDVQVLTPMYRGPVGVAALNARLQQTLNPPGRPLDRVLGGRLYRVGDKVLQTSNNYDKEVFNGDVGIIHSFNLIDQTMTVLYEDRSVGYDFVEAQDLLHAYAVSVHRSQGSEYPIVVMPIVSQHFMLLQRNLLYTAITRAKDVVILVGSQKAIGIAVRNDAISKRYTALAERLKGEI